MTNRFIEDIRKIAETDEIKRRLKDQKEKLDKSPIRIQRGVGISAAPFDPCQTLYTADDGIYTMKGLLDGTEGPQLVDGEYNKCDQLNTITGMYDIDNTELNCVLKPDGVFLDTFTDTCYFARWVFTYAAWFDEWDTQPFFHPTGKWFYHTKEDALNAEIAALTLYLEDVNGFTDVLVESDTLELVSIPQSWVDTNITSYYKPETITTDTILYQSTLTVTAMEGVDPYEATLSSCILEVQSNYDYYTLLEDPSITQILIPNILDAETLYIFGDSVPDFHPDSRTFQLAIEQTGARLWKPNPDETTAPIKYTNGVSTVRIGFGTTRYATVAPAKDGGFVIYETDVSYTPTGLARVYRGDRTLSAVIPVAQLAVYLPQI